MKKLLENFLPLKKDSNGKDIDIPDLPDIGKLVWDDARSILPPIAFKLADEQKKVIDITIHKIECQLEDEAKKGQSLQCARGKRELTHQEKLQKQRLNNKPQVLKTDPRSVKFQNRDRGLTGKRSNLRNTRLNQNAVTEDRRLANTRFRLDPYQNNFDPSNPDASLGDRAILFDSNGKVLRTASEIEREGRAIDESSKVATDKPVSGLAAKRRPKTELKNLTDAIDKTKKTGRITGLASLFAAVTGLVAVIGVLALLVPMSFVTVVLNWLQTITTMIANIKDMATTYLSITEAGLTLFGYPKLKSKISDTVNSVAYGIFGKENYESAKATFAQGVLNLTSLTKMLERIEAARRSTDSKIEGLKLSLGTANNSLKEAGLIPPDSPWMEYSEKIDKFAATANEETKENIEKLTAEIQTQEEIKKEIEEENKAKKEIKDKKQKELDTLKELGKDIKPIIEKQIASAEE